jgi:hypothetical protein
MYNLKIKIENEQKLSWEDDRPLVQCHVFVAKTT